MRRGLFHPGIGPMSKNPDDGFRSNARGMGFDSLPMELVNRKGDNSNEPGNNYKHGGLVTWEKSIEEWTGDISVTASQDVTFQNGLTIPNVCTGFRIISVVGTVQISINNSPLGTIVSGDMVDGWLIKNLRVVTAAASSCIVQAWGTGD